MAGIPENCWKYLKMAGIAGNRQKWLYIAGNDCEWL